MAGEAAPGFLNQCRVDTTPYGHGMNNLYGLHGFLFETVWRFLYIPIWKEKVEAKIWKGFVEKLQIITPQCTYLDFFLTATSPFSSTWSVSTLALFSLSICMDITFSPDPSWLLWTWVPLSHTFSMYRSPVGIERDTYFSLMSLITEFWIRLLSCGPYEWCDVFLTACIRFVTALSAYAFIGGASPASLDFQEAIES